MGKRLGRFIARFLDEDTVKNIAPHSWEQFTHTTEAYFGTGYADGRKPPYAGQLMVQTPYTDFYNLVWGLAPNQDMPKWRWMYRARPEIRRGVDTKVMLAVGHGFTVVCEEDKDLETYGNALLKRLKIREVLQSAATDMMVYGQAYFEKIRAVKGEEQPQEKLNLEDLVETVEGSKELTKRWTSERIDRAIDAGDPDTIQSWSSDIKKIDSFFAQPAVQQRIKSATKLHNGDGELIELKPLDPLWMRVNRDAFNNVIGFAQWGFGGLPQTVPTNKVVYLPWMPKSWNYEGAYGTSILMPASRHVSLLIQAEEDMKFWQHQYAKPMLVVKAGTTEAPYPLPRLAYLRDQFAARQPGTDAIVPADVDVQVLKGGTGETVNTFKIWSDYLREKIYESIGMPSVLMNLPDQTVRATSDSALQAFIAEERAFQDTVGDKILAEVIVPELKRVFPAKFEGKDPIIRVVWPPIMEEDWNKLVDRIVKAVGKPFMTINEARVRSGLKPLEGDEYNELPEAPMGGIFSQFSKPEPSESEESGEREEMKLKRDRDYEAFRARRFQAQVSDDKVLEEVKEYNDEYGAPASLADIALEFAPADLQETVEEWWRSKETQRQAREIERRLGELEKKGLIKKVEGGYLVV